MTRLRLVLIGPVLPFRGGIAQHTTMLHRTLAEHTDLVTISYTRQYPSLIYPGESDRDPGYEGYREPGVHYLIDSVNPWTWQTAVQAAIAYDPLAVIIPWWMIYWAPCYWFIAKRLRSARQQVIFFCHNVLEHESARWKVSFTRAVFRTGTGFVVHTREDEANLRALLRDPAILVQPHPIYEHFPPARGVLPRRAKLELLFYGFVRPYKGLDVLIEAMALLSDLDVKLSVVGEFLLEGKEPIERRIKELALEQRVEIVPRYVTDAETAEHFHRADAVILPYRSATGSGVVPIAYHYEKPVVVSRVGGLTDVVKDGETGYLVSPNSPRAVADAVRRLYSGELKDVRAAIRAMKERLSWTALADRVVELARYGERGQK